jgi:pimeloyl-ACP methyl ester carboxylesterase
VLAAARFPKVLVRGAWPPERFPGRETLARAYREVYEVIVQAIDGRVVVFKDSAHNPQMEEAEQFNSLLRGVWRSTRQH